MATVESITADALEAGGFEALDNMNGTVLLADRDEYYGIPSVKKCEISRLIDTCGEYKGAEFVYTMAVRCIGAECGFTDLLTLDSRIALTAAYLLAESGCTVRSIVRGEAERSAVTGRLERVLTFTLVGYEELSNEE